ncbi:hypothetical protein [Streptomyces sp. NPDC047070]|uniref:hypothetical protein n=1 Tax=Streptomyces sp. NPDC047070 TaxID=3154923 RepID=UPI003452560E
MSPAEARGARRERVAELRAAEPDLSLRQMGLRLGLSRDTVRRDLVDLDRLAAEDATAAAEAAPPVVEAATGDAGATGPVSQTAPQVSTGGARDAADSATPAEVPAAPVAQRAPLPRRLAGPLALPDGFDLRQWPAVRRDLATLAQTGMPVEKIVHDAIVSVAHHYRRALDAGAIQVDQPFTVVDVKLRMVPVARRTRQADQ